MSYTRKKICKFYDVCNNCGKHGHTFKQCKNPITSFGVIIFRVHPQTKQREYLMIRRKDTLGYIDFMRGKYSTQNSKYVLNMFRQMTRTEKIRILSLTFDQLWTELWCESDSTHYPSAASAAHKSLTSSPYYDSFRQEEVNSREKFHYLSTTHAVDPSTNSPSAPTLLQALIYESQTDPLLCWEEPEWGFPKGRRNHQERDYECALREMAEETGYSVEDVKNIKNILPFEEYFMGSNYKSYKHKYYLMYMDYGKSLGHETHVNSIRNVNGRHVSYSDSEESGENHHHQFARDEVSSIEWKPYEDCIQCIRPYNLEKKRLISNIEYALNHYAI